MSGAKRIALGAALFVVAPVLIVVGFLLDALWPVEPGIDSYVPPFLGVMVALPFALVALLTGVVFLIKGFTTR